MSAGEALSSLTTIYGAVHQIEDNRDDLMRISRRIEHILRSLEDSRSRDIIRGDDYNDALSSISDLILRTQRITQRLLKRSLGNRTWKAAEIAGELKRLNDDVQSYLSVHTIQALDIMQASQIEKFSSLSNNVEEIMVKIAEIDIRLRTPPGDTWDEHIQSRALDNLCRNTHSEPNLNTSGENSSQEMDPSSSERDVSLHALAKSARTTIQISGLRSDTRGLSLDAVTFTGLKMNSQRQDILRVINDAGYAPPDRLCGQGRLSIVVTEHESTYDATGPDGLQISSSEPLLWWWSKYTAYHGIAPATTPGHTIAKIGYDGKSIIASDVSFGFHRTLRVPDGSKGNDLPPDMGCFPLIPVSKYANQLPENIRGKGGFFMPVFNREAIWISFNSAMGSRVAVKLSVGGVNAISGIATNSTKNPDVNQDYVVVGLQPWLDSIATAQGIVRQFVVTKLGQGYTVEEQVTGKAEHGVFQFDVFPRRPLPDGRFLIENSYESVLDNTKTPAELGIGVGRTVTLRPVTWSELFRDERTLSDYRRRISPSVMLKAEYDSTYSPCFGGPSSAHIKPRAERVPQLGILTNRNNPFLGVSAGGNIVQNVYRDFQSPRVYDEENGHRFHVHVVSPEFWEDITGVLPPITPVTRDMYKRYSIPWFALYDNYVPCLTSASNVLGKVKSVAQLHEEKKVNSSELIDPDRPPNCPLHPRFVSSSVFRPCGHSACDACLSSALLEGSTCNKCKAAVTRFVGVKRPIPQVTRTTDSGDSEEAGEGAESEWNIHEIESFAARAPTSNQVTVIHLAQDSVSPLYSRPVVVSSVNVGPKAKGFKRFKALRASPSLLGHPQTHKPAKKQISTNIT